MSKTRTTVTLDDDVFRAVKIKAGDELRAMRRERRGEGGT
jgi:hypothetical protein